MKKIYLFCTRLRAYWMLLPLGGILALGIIFNGEDAGLLHLYPLIIASILGICFVLVYFARFISISFDTVKYIGPFSSKDRATVKKDRTFNIRMLPHGKIKISLWGDDGPCDFSWLKPKEGEDAEPDDKPRDICLFRGKTFGGKRTVKRILKYFGADKLDFDSILGDDGFKKAYEFVTVTNGIVDDAKEIYITVNETL